MNEPKNFLARWSRLKVEAEKKQAPDRAAASPEEYAPRDNEPASPAAPAFDPHILPQIETITAATDLKAFLAPGVPVGLAQAALRRAWTLDPNIRDFVGPADYAWDYHAPTPGFRPLELTEELRRQVLRMLDGQTESGSTDSPSSPSPAPEPVVFDTLGGAQERHSPVTATDPQIQTATATEPSPSGDKAEFLPKRSHGRALPE
jgi:hypothetical protein